MHKTLLFFCIFFISCVTATVSAQSFFNNSGSRTVVFKSNVKMPLNNNEKRMLIEVYGESLKENVLDKPERLKSIKNILRNRVEIYSILNYEKEYKLLSQVPLFDKYNTLIERKKFKKTEFNPLKYNFDFYAKGTQVFRVDNTDYYIVIKSQHQN